MRKFLGLVGARRGLVVKPTAVDPEVRSSNPGLAKLTFGLRKNGQERKLLYVEIGPRRITQLYEEI